MSSEHGARSTQGTALRVFRSLAGDYDAVVDLATMFQDRKWKMWLSEAAMLEQGGLVLDIGCGTLLLEEEEGTGATFIGLDLTAQMLREGKKKRLENVALLINADAEFLPFRDSSFDKVVSCYVPKYADPEAFGGEAPRVLKPDGKLVVYDFVRPRGGLSLVIRLYLVGLSTLGRGLWLARSGAAVTLREISGIVERANWPPPLVSSLSRHGLGRLTSRSFSGVVFGVAGVKERAESAMP